MALKSLESFVVFGWNKTCHCKNTEEQRHFFFIATQSNWHCYYDCHSNWDTLASPCPTVPRTPGKQIHRFYLFYQ